MAAMAAMVCNCDVSADSLARAPYCTVMPSSTRATAVPRAGSVPVSPVYQESVFAAVPGTCVVAVANGGPPTRGTGLPPKNSLDAFNADAATSAPLARAPTAVVNAALTLAAVAVELAPIRNWPACGGVVVVAVNCTFSLVPSGRLNASVMVSPVFRLVAPRSNDPVAGEPVGPVVVTLAADEVIEASFRPNGPASSVNEIDVAVGVACVSRPVPEPTSACLRSAINCFRPACAPTPSRMSPVAAVAAVSVARPENR